MGASWNTAALLSCSLNNTDTEWVMNPIQAPDVYLPLITQIQNAGYSPHLFLYDWRKEISTNAQKLNTFIENLSLNDKVHLVGHSMGGLVGKSYLDQTTSNNKLDKFMTAS